MVYLFIGEDPPSKDLKLAKIKQEFLTAATIDFNFEVTSPKEISRELLQEKILTLPIKAKKRIIVIRDAQLLKDDVREFILKFAGEKGSSAILVLDIADLPRKDDFFRALSRLAHVEHFKDTVKLDTFALARQIEACRMDYALQVLNQLLEDGEKPERIIGGLRYAWGKGNTDTLLAKKKHKALLTCDIDIKTGRLRPDFALEKLVIKLCSFSRA